MGKLSWRYRLKALLCWMGLHNWYYGVSQDWCRWCQKSVKKPYNPDESDRRM